MPMTEWVGASSWGGFVSVSHTPKSVTAVGVGFPTGLFRVGEVPSMGNTLWAEK